MIQYKIEKTDNGLRLGTTELRSLVSEKFTWANLLYGKLGTVEIYLIYFPSRFDLDVDKIVMDALRVFGDNTSKDTAVDFWDPKDPQFSKALEFFDQKSPPILVFVTGLKVEGINPIGPDNAYLYAISIKDQQILSDKAKLASATNTIHEVLARGDPKEITSYLRQKKTQSLISTIAKIGGGIQDEIIKLKPTITLPDGTSIQIGG